MFSSTQQHTLSIAILGTDAVLAARPASAIQLAHAVLKVGYDAVYPATWGDELVAAGCLQRVAERDGGSVVLCACPLVAHRLLRHGDDIAPRLLAMVSPPVAVARYLRALHTGRPLHVTYIGGCPDGDAPEIDAHLTPAELDAELTSRGIITTRQPQYFESVLPPDRRRFYSLPGGAPAPNWLASSGQERTLVTLAGDDLAAELAQTLLTGGPALIDVAPMLGCPCSGASHGQDPTSARDEASRVDPPRAPSPIVDTSLPIELDRELPAVSPRDELDDEGDAAEFTAMETHLSAELFAALDFPDERIGRDIQEEIQFSPGETVGELLHRFSRAAAPMEPDSSPAAASDAIATPRQEPAAEGSAAPTRRTTPRTPPFVAPVPPRPVHEGGAPQAQVRATGSPVPSSVSTEAESQPSAEPQEPPADASAVAVFDEPQPAPAPPRARRTTPTSLRRLAQSAPTVRTESGRSIPRAYAALRRTPHVAADAVVERETAIEQAFEPLAPPADFRPPIMQRPQPSEPARRAAPADLPPRPASMVPHRTITITPRSTHFSPPPRRRSRSRGVLTALAVVGLGALSMLAFRHLMAREPRPQEPAPLAVEAVNATDIAAHETHSVEAVGGSDTDSVARGAAAATDPATSDSPRVELAPPPGASVSDAP